MFAFATFVSDVENDGNRKATKEYKVRLMKIMGKHRKPHENDIRNLTRLLGVVESPEPA